MSTLLQKQIKLLRKWVNYHYIPFWHVNHLDDVSSRYIYLCQRHIWTWKGSPAIFVFISSFFQSLYWHHAWPPADPSQAASVTLWLTGALWASAKQPWSAEPWASTPVPQPDTAEQGCPRTKFFRALKETQSQPGGTATFPPSGSLHLVEQDLNESSGNGCLLSLVWVLTLDPKCLQWTTIKGVSHLLALYYFLLVKLLFLFLIK